MHHGKISADIAKGLKVLYDRIADSKVPSSKLDESLTIATWNIREFGKKRRLEPSIHLVAEIIGQFDIVAVVELRDNLADLRRVTDILGPYWQVVFSDWIPDRAGNKERMAYVFDKRAVTFTGLASDADPARVKVKVSEAPVAHEYLPRITWWRSPYIASFRAGNFDFLVITAHIRWGEGAEDRVGELELLADWVAKRQKEKYVCDKDIIVLGDFNIPSQADATFRAITSRGLRIPAGLRMEEGGFGTNLARDKRYDQILYGPAPGNEELFTGKGGVLDWYAGDHRRLFPGVSLSKEEMTYQISDHLPLWIQLDTDNDTIQLDQLLNRAK
jgi:endonuclease/exonuclease/phosphatase family metal-dependent hydrolase